VDTWLWLAIIIIMENDQVLMDKWRSGGVIGFWTIVISSVSIKDGPLLIPLVMLNAYLTFSWPDKSFLT
jgi:hypothetical protein